MIYCPEVNVTKHQTEVWTFLFVLYIIFLSMKTLYLNWYTCKIYLSCYIIIFCVYQIMHFIKKRFTCAQIHNYTLYRYFTPTIFFRYHGVNLVPTICWQLVKWCFRSMIRLTFSIKGTGRAWTTGTWSLSGWRRMTPVYTSARCRLLSPWSTTCS